MKNLVIRFLYSSYKKLNNLVASLSNRRLYKKGYIPELEFRLRKEFLKETEHFGTDDFYQSYPPLKISGKRNTLCRYKMYGLSEKLNKEQRVLDIGGNIGFFSIFLSRFVKSVDIVEQNSNLTNIGKKLLEHENLDNIKIINEDFKKFTKKEKYDLVFSLAIHKWVGMDFQDYLNKIHSLLKKDGLLLIESHIIYCNKGDEIEGLIRKNKLFEIIEKGAIDDHDGKYREFFWLKAK